MESMEINTVTLMTTNISDNLVENLAVDYHSHILPGCDHGSANLETSMKQVELSKKAGIKVLCATSHFYPHRESVESFLERRNASAKLLSEHIDSNSQTLLLGAEVLICDGIDRLEGLERLCLQGTDELMIEMPFYEWPEEIIDTFIRLTERKEFKVVLAHADRYPTDSVMIAINEGVKLQLNACCLMNPFKRKRYFDWIDQGHVKYLGSDIHELGNGYHEYEKARKILLKRFGR